MEKKKRRGLPFERLGESLYEKESREAEEYLAKERAARKHSKLVPTAHREDRERKRA
jgi:hypothetical protein